MLGILDVSSSHAPCKTPSYMVALTLVKATSSLLDEVDKVSSLLDEVRDRKVYYKTTTKRGKR